VYERYKSKETFDSWTCGDGLVVISGSKCNILSFVHIYSGVCLLFICNSTQG